MDFDGKNLKGNMVKRFKKESMTLVYSDTSIVSRMLDVRHKTAVNLHLADLMFLISTCIMCRVVLGGEHATHISHACRPQPHSWVNKSLLTLALVKNHNHFGSDWLPIVRSFLEITPHDYLYNA